MLNLINSLQLFLNFTMKCLAKILVVGSDVLITSKKKNLKKIIEKKKALTKF